MRKNVRVEESPLDIKLIDENLMRNRVIIYMVLASPNKLPLNYKEGNNSFIVEKLGRGHLTSVVPGLAHTGL